MQLLAAKSTTVRSAPARRVLWAVLALLSLPTAGRSAAPATPRSGIVTPTAITPEMAAWAHRRAAGRLRPLSRLRALHAAFVTEGTWLIEEIVDPSPSATEAFATKRSDCMGFALLLVGLAREVGVEASYVFSTEIDSGDTAGSLRTRRGHVATTFDGRVFDLGGEEAFDPTRHELISDRTAVALYYSNRGVQELSRQKVLEAVELLWRALRSDPSLGAVWSNLGVALRRSGDSTGAVLAHQMALRLDPANRSAMMNLWVATEDEE